MSIGYLRASMRKFSSSNDSILRFLRDNKAIVGSTVHKGTLYELTVERELRRKLLMQDLDVVGGSNDGGVDLTCKWPVSLIYQNCIAKSAITEPKLPLKGSRINGKLIRPLINHMDNGPLSALTMDALVQCKAFTSKISPKEIREMAGTFLSIFPNKRKSDALGLAIMCSPHLLTPSSIKLIDQLTVPFLYLRIETLQLINSEEYDILNSGQLRGYMANQVLKQYLVGTGFEEWMNFELYNEILI